MTVITTDYVEPDLNWEIAQYATSGLDYRIFQLRHANAQKLLENIADADVLVVDQAKIDSTVIQGLSRCRLIMRHGDGYDNLDLEAATKAGIICANQPGFFSRNAAEQSFAMALSLAFRIPVQQEVAAQPLLNTGWELSRTMPYRGLQALTVGILGYGKIGRQTAALFAGLTKEVLICSNIFPMDIAIPHGSNVPFNQLLAQSDILCIHIPLTPENAKMFDAATFASMKQGALLVNTSRGGIVDTNALVDALKSGHLAGAALDVTDPEPLPVNHVLFGMQNVIITPHMGWYSEDAMESIRHSILDDVMGVAHDRIPSSVVNPDVFQSPLLRLKQFKSK